jgi:putative hydrolase of the HAD superfamily
MIIESPGNGFLGVVFDAVGTLIEPDPPVAVVYAGSAARQGVSLDLGEVKTRFLRVFRDDEEAEARAPLATDEPAEYRRWQRIVARVLPELPDPARGFEELWTHFSRPESWRCFPDVAPTLDGLRARGFVVRIGSNFDGRLRAIVRGLADLAALVEGLVISSEVGYRKPHPEFFRAVRDAFDLPPDRIVCVGDDLENDVLGAERAGLRGVLVDRRGRHKDRSGLASLVELTTRWLT